MKTTIISQAISLGFDFEQFAAETELQEVEQAMLKFFKKNYNKLERLEDECEVKTGGRGQYVSYGDFCFGGEIVDFSAHWSKKPDTKVFHSHFVMEQDGVMKNMNLYCLVGETDYNTPIKKDTLKFKLMRMLKAFEKEVVIYTKKYINIYFKKYLKIYAKKFVS